MTEHKNHDHTDDIDKAVEINSIAALVFDRNFISTNSLILKFVIARTQHCKIHIYPDDHNPPHFHILKDGESVGFAIQTGTRLEGHKGLRGFDRKVNQYWKTDRCLLAKKWNNSRPDHASNQIFTIPKEWRCNGSSEEQD